MIQNKPFEGEAAGKLPVKDTVLSLMTLHGMRAESLPKGMYGFRFRISPTDPIDMQAQCYQIAGVLSDAGYSDYYLKQCDAYLAGKNPWRPDSKSFIELEFWYRGDNYDNA